MKVTSRSADMVVYFPPDMLNGNEMLETEVSGINSIPIIEKELTKALNCIRTDGVFVGFIPAFLLHDNIRLMLLKKLKDIYIINIEKEKRYPVTDLCMVIGTKTILSDIANLDTESIRRMNEYLLRHKIRTRKLSEIEYPDITLPSKYKKLEQFRGIQLSADLIKELCKDDSLLKELQKRTCRTHSITDKRPLLPFTSGQLGLVLVSGQLDGIIKEKNGHSHVIKGMTTKSSYFADSTDRNVTSSVITTNTVRIALFDKNGNYKQLV